MNEKGFQIKRGDGETSIQAAFERLYEMGGLNLTQRNIVEAFFLFPYIPLPQETCADWLMVDAGMEDRDEFGRALSRLAETHWLQRMDSEEEVAYAMHAVVRAAVRGQGEPLVEHHSALIEACSDGLSFDAYRHYTDVLRWLPFGESIFKPFSSVGDSAMLGGLAHNVARILGGQADYSTALEWYWKALAIREKVLGTERS
jgi:hypothetical protein